MMPRIKLALAVAVLPQAALAQPSPTDPGARADELARQGIELGKKHKWIEAEVLFREAWSVKQSFDIAGNLGQKSGRGFYEHA